MNLRGLWLALALLPALMLGPLGCETMSEHKIATGTAIGAASGAALGAVIGHQSGHAGAGAAIGGLAGAALGGGIGYALDRQEKKFRQIQDVQVQKVPAGPETVAAAPSANAPAPVQNVPEHLTLRMNSEVLFQQGQSALSPAGYQKMAEIANTLREYRDSDVIIKGFTSSEGGDALNVALSQRRAEAVRNALIAERVAPERLTALGMGSSKPIASNESESGRAANRRVEIDVIPRGEVR